MLQAFVQRPFPPAEVFFYNPAAVAFDVFREFSQPFRGILPAVEKDILHAF